MISCFLYFIRTNYDCIVAISIFITNKKIIIIWIYEISFISSFIFLYSVLMFKLNCINQQAHLINWVLQFYLYQILFSIIVRKFWMFLIFFLYYYNYNKYCTMTFFT